MILPTLDFIWRETLLQLRRERLIAVSTISIVAVLLVLLGANLLLVLNLRLWTARTAHEVEVAAYFQKGFARLSAQRVARTIATWPEVESARFVPREEGWEELRKSLAGSVKLEGFTAAVLPDAVRVRVHDPRQAEPVAKKLLKAEGIKDVPDRFGGFARGVVRFKNAVTWAGLVISILVGIAGVFIVHNTVRLALYARWREIYIMQLVGATRALIAAPFLLEGAIHGAIGAWIACCLLVPGHMYLRTLAARNAPFFLLQPDEALIPFALYLILGGAALGVIGSLFSLRRFLRRRPEWQT
jgi:cell division transport system permease protein